MIWYDMTELWQKGVSANPAGRPKGIKNKVKRYTGWSALISDVADKRDEKGIKSQTKIVRKLLKLAEEGEQWAVREVLDRVEGKALQRQVTDITTGGESLNASISFVGMGAGAIVDALPASEPDLLTE